MAVLNSRFIKFVVYFLFVCYAQENESDKEPPRGCNLNPREALESYNTVEDFDCCAPYMLPDYARKYFQTGAGRQVTLQETKLAYKKFRIVPKMLRDVSHLDLKVTVLGHKISMPIALSPVAMHKFASDLGEVDTVRAVDEAGTLMILSSYSTTLIEDVASAAPSALKWMQTYIFPNRSQTVDLVKRAEAAGFKAIVVTSDSPIPGPLPDNARDAAMENPKHLTTVNIADNEHLDASLTFKDLAWLKRVTKLPIVAKGILTAADAVRALRFGASAILVSNHGGRQLDSAPPSGQEGVKKVFDILRTELNETMTLAGTPNVRAISKDMVIPGPCCTDRYNTIPASYATVKTCRY